MSGMTIGGARARLGLAVVCAGALVGPFDTTVNTAFPVITEAFGLARADIQWVVIAYVLAQSAFALLFGHVGDRIGHRRVFAIGLAASACAHAAVALSTDFATFVWMRAVQGVAVGITLACAPALATLMFPPQHKGRVLAVYAATASLGMAIAPWLGGILLAAFGWPGVYWFRVPLAAAALLLLPVAPPAAASAQPAPGGQAAAQAPPAQRVPPRFWALQFASAFVNFGCFANLILLPYVLTGRMGASIVTAGLLLSAYPAGSVIGNLLPARFGAGRHPHRSMTLGIALAACGLLAIAGVLLLSPSLPALAAAMFACGLGLGLFSVGYMDETTSLLPVRRRGVAGSLVTVTRLVGVLLGATLISRLQEVTASEGVGFAWLGLALALFAAVFGVVARPSADGEAAGRG